MFPFFKKKPKIIVVLGQTSTGKSDLAVEIAQKFNGEVISADSRQVYRGMDLGSGKITHKEMQGVPHHLLDVADPKNIFSVADFQKLGTQAIQDILSRGKIPIVCGGTGFYIDALIYQTSLPEVPPNEKLRKELAQKSIEELQYILKEKLSQKCKLKHEQSGPLITYLYTLLCSIINIVSGIITRRNDKVYKGIDMQNPVRIIRAIEIIDALGYIPKIKKHKIYNTLFIGLTLPKKQLDERIHQRIIKRLEQGMLKEAKRLLKSGVSHQRLQSLGLEYRFMSKYILGELSYNEMIKQLTRATIQFAKRQRTWFKRNKEIHWFNPLDKTERRKIFTHIEKFLQR